MSSHIFRSASRATRSLLSSASKGSRFYSGGRAAAAVSLSGKLPLFASACGNNGSANAPQWISGALAIPMAAYMLQEQEARAGELERTFIAIKPDGVQRGLVWEGEGAIKYGRKLIGATDPQKSEPGSIRGDLAVVVGRNIIHGSDGPETAKDEIKLWFKPEELVNYTSNSAKWIYGDN
ncbi:Nucleoside diphosphate kinase 4, chloroplastic [Linum perenne]